MALTSGPPATPPRYNLPLGPDWHPAFRGHFYIHNLEAKAMTDEERLFHAMCTIQAPVEDDITIRNIRNRFMKADKSWSEADAIAEWRYFQANAILIRWKKAIGYA